MDNRESAIKLLSFALRCTFRDRINDHLDLKKFTEIHDDMLRVTFEVRQIKSVCMFRVNAGTSAGFMF